MFQEVIKRHTIHGTLGGFLLRSCNELLQMANNSNLCLSLYLKKHFWRCKLLHFCSIPEDKLVPLQRSRQSQLKGECRPNLSGFLTYALHVSAVHWVVLIWTCCHQRQLSFQCSPLHAQTPEMPSKGFLWKGILKSCKISKNILYNSASNMITNYSNVCAKPLEIFSDQYKSLNIITHKMNTSQVLLIYYNITKFC